MKYLPLAASILLGGLFIMSGVTVLFNLAPIPEPPRDTPVWHFMSAFIPTGYMKFVKVFELLGGILDVHHFVPPYRAFHHMLLIISLLALYLLWSGRKAWRALVS